MKKILFISFVLLITFPLCDAQKLKTKHLYKTWVYSYEDNKGDTLVYRPETYQFPPSRGRISITFFKNGKFNKNEIAPADGFITLAGSWEITKDSIISLKFIPDKIMNNYPAEMKYKLTGLTAKLLKMVKINNTKQNLSADLVSRQAGRQNISLLLCKKWFLSYEESKNDTLVYRPETYKFPPSRGRKSITFEESGKFSFTEIAPACGFDVFSGKWEFTDDSFIKIVIDESTRKNINFSDISPYQYQIIKLEDDLLILRKLKP